MNQYLKYAAVAVVAWRVAWLLIYYLSGFYISYISINNGVSFNGIAYHGKVHISLNSLRFRLWGNTRRIIFSNLCINVLPRENTSRPKRASTPSEEPLSIYPKSFLLKPVVKLVLYLIRSLDVEMRDVSVFASMYQFSLDSVQVVLDSKHKVHSTNSYNLSLVNSVTKASVHILDPKGPSKPLAIGSLSLSFKLSIDAKSGRLSNISTRLHVDDLVLKAFSAIRHVILHSIKDGSKSAPRSDHKSTSQQSLESKIDNYILIHNRVLQCFKEISLNVANFNIEEIPIFSPSNNYTLKEYFAQKSIDSSLFMCVESISIHLARVLNTSAGYEVLFNHPWDSPFELTVSTLLLKLGYRGDIGSGKEKKRQEFLSIPSYSLTFKTNIIDHLVHGYGLKNCVLELFSSGNSPMFDADVRLLALLWYNYLVLKKLMRLRSIEKNESSWESRSYDDSSDSESDGEDSTDSEGTAFEHSHEQHISMQIVDKVMSLLEDYYPRIDIKLTMEQPRALLRLHNEKDNKTQMLMVSYSMMVMHVLTTEDHDYDSMCHFMHPSVTFSEKSCEDTNQKVFTEEFCGLGDAHIDFQVLKYLKFQAAVSLSGAFIKLVKPDVLNGINSIITTATRAATENLKRGRLNRNLDARILSDLAKYSPKKVSPTTTSHPEDFIFASLPSWFISAEFKFDGLTVMLGSTSPLLPPSYIYELSKKSVVKFTETSSVLTFKIGLFKLLIENVEDKALFEGSDQISSSTTSETSSVSSVKDSFWDMSLQISDTSLKTSDTRKKVTVLNIPEMKFQLRSQRKDSKNELVFDTNIDQLDTFLDRQIAFTAIGSFHLIMETIVKPIKKFQNSFRRERQILRSRQKKTSSFKVQDYLVINFDLKRVNSVLSLSEEIKIRMQNYDLKVSYEKQIVQGSNILTRVMVSSPTVPGHWDRVLIVDSVTVRFNTSAPGESIIIETSAIRICQPHKFVVYKLFDNLSIFMKVMKHLVKCLKQSEMDIIVRPTESKPIELPPIRLKSKKITFTIEDDPFESDLNMIYQLGLVEQRKRNELQESFDEKVKLNHDKFDQEEIDENQDALNKVFESSWIRKVRVYKQKLSQECDDNKMFLFGEESNLSNNENRHVNAYSISAPLLSVILSGVNLQLSQPKFPPDQLSQFIYDNGQGVPKDTRYNLMIPMFMNVSIEELRMHLRDYPLPLFELPHAVDSSGKGRALLMSGHLVLSENLVLEDEHLRKLPVQLVEVTDDPEYQPNKFDKLIIEKSMATLKIYTDMDVLFDSSGPSRFIWGQSYQFGIQQIMLNVDQFSKPPVDPSSKLGFWDKLRYVMHGKMNIRTGKHASIEVGFKGDKDPYNMFGHANGFILSMKDSVEWRINEYDNSLKFFDIQAGRISWYIPNYLSSPLVCWTRPSSKPTFFPNMKEVLSSCHGYYLNDEARIDDLSKLGEVSSIPEKEVVQLSGGVTLNVGFLLQRKQPDSNEMSEEGKAHFEIELFNPNYTKEGHDSYEGFRTGRIHMALSFVAHTDESYNTIHLSPGVFNHFFDWWSLFKGNTMLPIRRGSLFGEVKNSEKFSEHLFTNKFLFDIKNLFISHIYRNEDLGSESDELECIGLRAKVDEFVVDLHQKKEEVFDTSDDTSRGKKVMKMMFNLGQVVLTKIDLRTVHAIFHRNVYTAVRQDKARASKDALKVFDKNTTWLDLEDFDEAFFPSSGFVLKSGEILPFLYSEKFAYLRDISGDRFDEDLSDDQTHDCTMYKTDYYSSQIEVYKRRLEDIRKLSKSDPSVSKHKVEERVSTLKSLIDKLKMQRRRSMHKGSVTSMMAEHRENFNNRFILVSMFLKWNEPVRNQFMKYIHFVQRSSSYKKLMSFEFMNMLENIIEKEKNEEDVSTLRSTLKDAENSAEELRSRLNKFESSQERIDNFNGILRKVKGNNVINEDYKIEVISPQIQLQSEQSKDSVVIITAPVLESKILSVKTNKDSSMPSQELERRYGVLLHDANVMVVEKSSMKAKQIALERQPYGTKTKWPPFLGIETCKSSNLAFEEDVLVNRMSLMLTFDQVMASISKLEQVDDEEGESPSNESKDSRTANRLRVDVPRLAINSTSKQYFALYVTVISLLLYNEPLAVELNDRISKLRFSNDFQDLPALHHRLTSLHKIVGISGGLLDNYNFRQDGYLDNEALNEYLLLTHTKTSLSDEIILTLQTLFSGDLVTTSSARVVQDWRIAADEIVLHMLNDDRSPIIDLKIEHGVCKRVLKDDGSNNNRIEIKSIEGVTLLENAFYKKFLEPLKKTNAHDLITVDWSMNRSIGGIKIIDNFNISSLPLNLSIDEETGSSLMKFIFRTDNEINESPILKVSETEFKDKNDDKNSDNDGRTDTDLDVASRGPQRSLATSRGNKNPSSKDSYSFASSGNDLDHDRDVTAMIDRSKKYISISKLTSQSFEIMISLRMKTGSKRLLNVSNFRLQLPAWEIETKVLSLLDVADIFKKTAIRALLSHSGGLLRNKVSSRKQNLKRFERRFSSKKSEKSKEPDEPKPSDPKPAEVANTANRPVVLFEVAPDQAEGCTVSTSESYSSSRISPTHR